MSVQPALVYLGLGANLGRRAQALSRALQCLAGLEGGGLARVSSVYQTAPWGVEEQPAFLNMVAAVRTTLEPAALLGDLKALEAQLGRVEGPRWGPRAVDLDILLWEGVEVRTAELTIPHARLAERQFVLVPVAEIAPDVEVAAGVRARDLAARDDPGIARLGRLAEVLKDEQATG